MVPSYLLVMCDLRALTRTHKPQGRWNWGCNKPPPNPPNAPPPIFGPEAKTSPLKDLDCQLPLQNLARIEAKPSPTIACPSGFSDLPTALHYNAMCAPRKEMPILSVW